VLILNGTKYLTLHFDVVSLAVYGESDLSHARPKALGSYLYRGIGRGGASRHD
jgi:hypothetical protein